MGTERLVENDLKRARDLGIFGSCQKQLGSADNHGQWVVDLVPGACREFGECGELLLPQARVFGLDDTAQRSRQRLHSPFQVARSISFVAQACQAARSGETASRCSRSGCARVAPELQESLSSDHGSKGAARAKADADRQERRSGGTLAGSRWRFGAFTGSPARRNRPRRPAPL